MGVTLTAAGEALIARLQAEGKPLIIDAFLFAHIEGQDHTLPPATASVVPDTHLVHSRSIPQEYRAYINPNQVVYSAMLGSDVGDFSFNWQGLYCSEHDTLIAVATFPALQKKAYDPATNTSGNNLTRNFMLEFSGAQKITAINVEAKVWQLDFTVRLKGIDERERLSNRDIYGRAAFMGDAWLLQNNGGTYSFEAGVAYAEGIRLELKEAIPTMVESLPCEVYLDVCMAMEGSDLIAKASPIFLPEGSNPLDYQDEPPIKAMHYLVPVAIIDGDGVITDLRAKFGGEEVQKEDTLSTEVVRLIAEGVGSIQMPPAYDISMTLNYFIGWHIFKGIHPEANPGMVPVNGNLLENAPNLYPLGWEYLQSAKGQMICTTEALWWEANHAVWAKLADGKEIGWEGIGGICKYVIDTNAGTIRVPDLRGMHEEVAGFDSLGVGGVHGDMVRGITGKFRVYSDTLLVEGVFRQDSVTSAGLGGNTNLVRRDFSFDASRAVPVGSANKPRAWGALACVYLGTPK